ncbi:unnamed protein product [Cochlearia groenlandica]
MADRFGYGGFSQPPFPFWLSSPSPNPQASWPSVLVNHPIESDSDPMVSHGSHQQSPADLFNNAPYRDYPYSHMPSSSSYADYNQLGSLGHSGEHSYEGMFSPNSFFTSFESPSDFVQRPIENFSERQPLNAVPSYSSTSATVSCLADLLIRNSQEPFYKPIVPSGDYPSNDALNENHIGLYHPGYDRPESMNADLFEPYVCGPGRECTPSLPNRSLIAQALFHELQSGIHSRDGRSFPSSSDVWNRASENFKGVQSSLKNGTGDLNGDEPRIRHWSDFMEPSLFSVGSESSGAMKADNGNVQPANQPSEYVQPNSDVCYRAPERPSTLVAASANGISESSLKNIGMDLNYEPKYWSHFAESSEKPLAPTKFPTGSGSCGAVKTENRNAQSHVNDKTPSEGIANQPSGNVEANPKPYELREHMFGVMHRDVEADVGIEGSSRSNADDVSAVESPERHLCDQGDLPSSASSPIVASVVNAMHNLSKVLVYECFNNGSCLKMEQLENLDKVVDNLTKCLKKITGNKTTAGEESRPSNIDLNEASDVAAKDCQGLNVKPLDSFGIKEPVDKNEMTQSIKNILSSNFPDGEENHPQTLLYKTLWLETEAALCSTSCMARYHRIKKEIGNLSLQETSASAAEDKHNDVIDGFQIQKQLETFLKLKAEYLLATKKVDHEENPEALEITSSAGSSGASNVMDRFQIPKQRPEAEQVQKTLNSLNIDSDSDSDSDSETLVHGDPKSASVMTRHSEFNSRIETCADSEPSASDKGYDSPTSDWEHVLKDD